MYFAGRQYSEEVEHSIIPHSRKSKACTSTQRAGRVFVEVEPCWLLPISTVRWRRAAVHDANSDTSENTQSFTTPTEVQRRAKHAASRPLAAIGSIDDWAYILHTFIYQHEAWMITMASSNGRPGDQRILTCWANGRHSYPVFHVRAIAGVNPWEQDDTITSRTALDRRDFEISRAAGTAARSGTQ